MMRRLSGACLAALVVVLVASPIFAKPPDLPQDAKIVVSPQTAGNQEALPVEPAVPESGDWRPFLEGLECAHGQLDPWMAALREMLSSSLIVEVHPFMVFWGEARPEAPAPSETTSECPYMRKQRQCQPVRVLNPNALPSVMDNLRALEQAVQLMFQARRLANEGCYDEALDCLAKARGLCPGTPFDQKLEELQKECAAAADAQKEKTTVATEQEEAEGCGCCCCGCSYGWLNQFGMCWMSQFVEWCKEQSQANKHEQGSTEACEEEGCSKTCGSACPKCEMLHAKYVKHAGCTEQVNGLMKACYFALGEGRFEKAADLARQAYALEPARVESDPLIYKLHLLAEESIKAVPAKCSCPEAQCPCPKSQCPKCCPGQEPKPAPENPGVAPVPDLPNISSDLPVELDEILTGKDALHEEACEEHARKCCFLRRVPSLHSGETREEKAAVTAFRGWGRW